MHSLATCLALLVSLAQPPQRPPSQPSESAFVEQCGRLDAKK